MNTVCNIAELYNIEAKSFVEPFSENDLRELVENEHAALCAEKIGGVCVGFALGRVIADEGELFRIAVLPEYRRRGIAEGLLVKFHEIIKKRGAAACFLEVRSKNTPAAALYKKLGYEQTRVIRDYYPDDDAVAMKIEFGVRSSELGVRS